MNHRHLQLLDSALPIGAFSHSFGLETLVQQQQIQSAADLQRFCETALFGVWAPCDLMLVKANYECEPAQIWRLDRELHVARAASEARDGQRKIGKRLLQLGRALYPQMNFSALALAIENGECVGAHPTIYGWICRELGVPLDEVATGFLFANVSSCVNNAVRAMRRRRNRRLPAHRHPRGRLDEFRGFGRTDRAIPRFANRFHRERRR